MKTLLNLALSCMILVTLSGCFDFAVFDTGVWGSVGGWGGSYYGGYYEPSYYATFYTDSVVQMSDSRIKIWAQIRYDSVLTIENRSISYLDSNNESIHRVIQSQPTAINFKELPDSAYVWTGKYEGVYKYTVELDSLVKNFDYNFYLSNTYTEKGILKSIQNGIYFRLK